MMAVSTHKSRSHQGQMVRFAAAHEELLALCDRLEAIADSLPENVDRQACIQTAGRLTEAIGEAHALEEQVIFPALVSLPDADARLLAAVERLRLEHVADSCFAEELSEALTGLGEGRPRQSADAMGYMLRGFFQSLRRHVAFERDYLAARLG